MFIEKMILLIIITTLLGGCGFYRLEKWSPKVGMAEGELIDHWGKSYDCSTYSSKYGTTKKCWYSIEPITGLIVGDYQSSPELPVMNILITIEGGKINSVYAP